MSITTFVCRHRVAFVPFFRSEGNLAFFWLEVSKLLFSSCQYVLSDVVSREHVNYEPNLPFVSRYKSSLSRPSNSSDKRFKLVHVAGLYIDGTRTRKAADKSFPSFETGHTSTSGFFNAIIAAPRHEMAVVDNVLFAGLKLLQIVSKYCQNG
jgi:hypothetical protein